MSLFFWHGKTSNSSHKDIHESFTSKFFTLLVIFSFCGSRWYISIVKQIGAPNLEVQNSWMFSFQFSGYLATFSTVAAKIMETCPFLFYRSK